MTSAGRWDRGWRRDRQRCRGCLPRSGQRSQLDDCAGGSVEVARAVDEDAGVFSGVPGLIDREGGLETLEDAGIGDGCRVRERERERRVIPESLRALVGQEGLDEGIALDRKSV